VAVFERCDLASERAAKAAALELSIFSARIRVGSFREKREGESFDG